MVKNKVASLIAGLMLIMVSAAPLMAQTIYNDAGDCSNPLLDISTVVVSSDADFLYIDVNGVSVSSEFVQPPSGGWIMAAVYYNIVILSDPGGAYTEVGDTDLGPSIQIVAKYDAEYLSDGRLRFDRAHFGDATEVSFVIYAHYYQLTSQGASTFETDSTPESPYWTYEFNSAPYIESLEVDPGFLWPPNNKMQDVLLAIEAYDDDGDVLTYTYDVVDEYGELTRSGLPLAGGFRIPLMASRLGGDLDGRVYEIIVTVTDPGGLSATGSVKVIVPHDMRK